MTRIGDAWKRAARRIGRTDARLLLEMVAGCRHTDLIAFPEREIPEEQAVHLETLLVRRERGEPLAYLLGSAWFMGLEFAVTADVLIPRPDTEVLVEAALECMLSSAARGRPARVVDLGTGSGIVAIQLARNVPGALVSAVDVSPAALAVARSNAERYDVAIRFLAGDWYVPLAGERFDVIVSNPPYIVAGDPHLQGDGLPFEPALALTDGVAGGDGLECIRALIAGAGAHLQPAGWLLLEHGYDQADQVREMLRAAGYSGCVSWRDAAGIERVSGAFLSDAALTPPGV